MRNNTFTHLAQPKKPLTTLVNNQFNLEDIVYSGPHSKIVRGIDTTTKQPIIAKIENVTIDERTRTRWRKIIKHLGKGPGVPNMLYCGEGVDSNITIFEECGPSLKNVFSLMKKTLGILTICQIALELISVTEYFYLQGVVFRNLRPNKILTSKNALKTDLFLIDFKYARRLDTGELERATTISFHQAPIRGGVNKFSSLSVHLGQEPSIKDDLESLAYLIVYLCRQGRIFESVRGDRETKMKSYHKIKANLIPEIFCSGLPLEILTYFNYVKYLNAAARPNFAYLKRLFSSLSAKYTPNPQGAEFHYDWAATILDKNREERKKKKDKYNKKRSKLDKPLEQHRRRSLDISHRSISPSKFSLNSSRCLSNNSFNGAKEDLESEGDESIYDNVCEKLVSINSSGIKKVSIERIDHYSMMIFSRLRTTKSADLPHLNPRISPENPARKCKIILTEEDIPENSSQFYQIAIERLEFVSSTTSAKILNEGGGAIPGYSLPLSKFSTNTRCFSLTYSLFLSMDLQSRGTDQYTNEYIYILRGWLTYIICD
eukprot:TRINITY_DN879_c0_g1_i1.p1 TRINITY_DN879_c0_g1~~TRINITY_DN879_c0_g1_i1.p1  ORF type:complete len:545 (+),score=54.46 TRINITY_DN879_c0_g1_i1:201-1835(+)